MRDFLYKFLFQVEMRINELEEMYKLDPAKVTREMITLNKNIRYAIKKIIDDLD